MLSVFGNSVTDATLAGMLECANKQTTAVNRARVALELQSADMKATKALAYVQNLKKEHGDRVSTVCIFYNATGNTLTFVSAKDWHGHIGEVSYPMQVQNGQWGAFLHVKGSKDATGSCSAVVYRGKNGDGGDFDCMMAWRNSGNEAKYENSVYMETFPIGYFGPVAFDLIYGHLQQTRYNHIDTRMGCFGTIAIGGGTCPIVEAKFTLEAVVKASSEPDQVLTLCVCWLLIDACC